MKLIKVLFVVLLLSSCSCSKPKPAKSELIKCGPGVKFMVDGDCVRGDVTFLSETLIKYYSLNEDKLVLKTAPFKITYDESN